VQQIEVIFRHLLTLVGRMFRRAAAAFALTFVVAVAITEAVASVLTNHFPPDPLTHVTAAIIGFSWGIVVSLAIAIEEGLRGFVVLIEDLAKTTERAADRIGREIAKEGGHLLQGVEHGVSTAVRDVTSGVIPGAMIGAVENLRPPHHLETMQTDPGKGQK
jgi:hypothetical protein